VKIAIVNDMTLAVEWLRRFIASMPGDRVAWVASNGAEALQKCAQETPDLILMDLIMPVMDGVEATRQIMARNPCAILIVTATIAGNAGKVIEALGAGALDAVQTPTFSLGDKRQKAPALTVKIDSIRKMFSESRERLGPGSFTVKHETAEQSLVVIGASAGGPSALAAILSSLPRGFPAPIVVVQHIDAQFAPPMAQWLADQCTLAVRVAIEGDKPEAGTVLVAATNDHLVFVNGYSIGYVKQPIQCHYRPSVDVFFESVVKHWNGKVLGVLLTGMGRDGAKGLKALREAGALTIAQDSKSCVVYGMPKAAVELNAAVEVLRLQNIASSLMKALNFDGNRI
jgi:two-component system response regulator WspF